MFMNRNKLLAKIKKLIGNEKYIYVTSYNYGLLNSLLLQILNIQDNYYIIDDGITNCYFKNRFNYIKTILHSIALRKLIYIPKLKKHNNNNNNDNIMQITSMPDIIKNKNFIDISFEYKKFIKYLSKSYKLKIQKNYNVMIYAQRIFIINKGYLIF